MSEVKGAAMELGTERIRKLLVQYAVPAIIAMTASSLYNMVDSIFIGHGVGALAISGLALTFPLMNLAAAFGSLVGGGAATLVSMRLGQRDYETAQRILGNVVVLNLIIGISFGLLTLVFLDPILYFFGASDATIGYAREYMSVILWGNVVTHMYLGLNAVLRAAGHPRKAMYATILTVTINAILDPLFIFVLGLGVRGAALATVISQAVSAVWVMTFLTGKKTRWYLKRENLHVDAKIVLPCIALGLSPFVMQSTESLIAICFNSSLLRYGGDMAVGTMTVLTSIMQFSNMPLQGLTQGAQPIVSYNFGAKNAQRVRDAYFCLLRACFTYSMAIWLLVELFPRAFILIFNNDPALVEYAAWAVRIYMGCSGIFGIQIACQQTFVALGNAKTSLFLAVWRKIILLIPLIYILPHFFADKAFAVFLAEPVADFGAVALTSFTFYRQFRRSMRELEGAEATGER